MSEGICYHCKKKGDMCIYDCGYTFCSSKCQKLSTYRPLMTDDTFENDCIIDEIELKDNTCLYLQSTDFAYGGYSGYKAIITKEGLFTAKQLAGFPTIKQAREVWETIKQKNKLKSWAEEER